MADQGAETAIPGLNSEKRGIYREFEHRIDTFKNLWKVAQALPIPSAGDPSTFQQENIHVRSFFDNALASSPAGQAKYRSYQELSNKIRSLRATDSEIIEASLR